MECPLSEGNSLVIQSWDCLATSQVMEAGTKTFREDLFSWTGQNDHLNLGFKTGFEFIFLRTECFNYKIMAKLSFSLHF